MKRHLTGISQHWNESVPGARKYRAVLEESALYSDEYVDRQFRVLTEETDGQEDGIRAELLLEEEAEKLWQRPLDQSISRQLNTVQEDIYGNNGPGHEDYNYFEDDRRFSKDSGYISRSRMDVPAVASGEFPSSPKYGLRTSQRRLGRLCTSEQMDPPYKPQQLGQHFRNPQQRKHEGVDIASIGFRVLDEGFPLSQRRVEEFAAPLINGRLISGTAFPDSSHSVREIVRAYAIGYSVLFNNMQRRISALEQLVQRLERHETLDDELKNVSSANFNRMPSVFVQVAEDAPKVDIVRFGLRYRGILAENNEQKARKFVTDLLSVVFKGVGSRYSGNRTTVGKYQLIPAEIRDQLIACLFVYCGHKVQIEEGSFVLDISVERLERLFHTRCVEFFDRRHRKLSNE